MGLLVLSSDFCSVTSALLWLMKPSWGKKEVIIIQVINKPASSEATQCVGPYYTELYILSNHDPEFWKAFLVMIIKTWIISCVIQDQVGCNHLRSSVFSSMFTVWEITSLSLDPQLSFVVLECRLWSHPPQRDSQINYNIQLIFFFLDMLRFLNVSSTLYFGICRRMEVSTI